MMNLKLRLYCLKDLRNFVVEPIPVYGIGPKTTLILEMIFRLIQIKDTMQKVRDIPDADTLPLFTNPSLGTLNPESSTRDPAKTCKSTGIPLPYFLSVLASHSINNKYPFSFGKGTRKCPEHRGEAGGGSVRAVLDRRALGRQPVGSCPKKRQKSS